MAGSTTLETRLAGRKELFWDISPERVKTALHENDDWAIVRLFEYGTLDDIKDTIEFYGKDKVVSVLSRERLKPTAAVMAYLFLNVDRYDQYHRSL